jgi:hypothetical protein
MKKLKEKRKRMSEESGWEMMWLDNGIENCSKKMMKEIKKLISCSKNNVEKDYLNRIKRIIRNGKTKNKNNKVEVEDIKKK